MNFLPDDQIGNTQSVTIDCGLVCAGESRRDSNMMMSMGITLG